MRTLPLVAMIYRHTTTTERNPPVSIEKATIVGNLVSDPELRYTASGNPVTQIRIASSRSVLNRDTGQREDRDHLFLTVSCWKSLGENVAASLRKGQRVIATGRLIEHSWETKDGERRSRIEMTADAIGLDLRFASAHAQPSVAAAPDGHAAQGQGNDPWGSGQPQAQGHAWGQQ